jgi:hypothetical protein
MNLARILRSLGMVLLAVALAGCTGSSTGATATPPASAPVPTPTPTAIPTPVSTPVSTADASTPLAMHVTLAANWQSVEMTEASLTAEIALTKDSNPVLSQALQQLLDGGFYKSIQLYAFGFTGIKQIGNLVGTASAIGANVSIDALKPFLEAQFKQLGGTGAAWSTRTLTAGEATVVDLSLALNGKGSVIEFTDRIFNIIQDGVLYQTTFTCYPGETQTCLADADTMAQHWTIGP